MSLRLGWWVFWAAFFSSITAEFLGGNGARAAGSAVLMGLIGVYATLQAKEGIREENKRREDSWHARPDALERLNLTRKTAAVPGTDERFASVVEAVKIQKRGLLLDKKLMYVVSDFNLEEVLYMAELSADALYLLGYRSISEGIKQSLSVEFDPVFRSGAKSIKKRFLILLKNRIDLQSNKTILEGEC